MAAPYPVHPRRRRHGTASADAVDKLARRDA